MHKLDDRIFSIVNLSNTNIFNILKIKNYLDGINSDPN